MTIAKDFAAKLAVAFVAVAMVLSAFAPATQAQTTEELQAMINDLLAQVASLSGETSDDSASAAGVCPFTWTRDLSTGSTGADVKALQQFLNANADTRVAATGAGSMGMETEFFGPATGAAVSKFQVMHRADVLTPAGLVNPTGYFGPGTRAKANALCVSASTDDSDDSTDDSDDSEDSEDAELSGEASLDALTMDSASDDELEEGAEDAEIAMLTVEFADGDAEISRIDAQVIGGGDETNPWDTFETISLWVDGDMVAEFDASDEDEYLDEDTGEIRFSGLDIVAMEDEEVEITIAATVQTSVDGTDDGESWTVEVNALRFFDADGVATTEDTGLDFGSQETFTIEEAGSEDEIVVKTSTSDPDAATLQVEDDAKSDWFTVFVFDLDTDDSINDIELNEVSVIIDVASSSAAANDMTYAELVDDVELVIDGVTIDDLVVSGGAATSTSGNYDASRLLRFDVDGDVVIEAGDRVAAELKVRFNSLAIATDEGTTVRARVNGASAKAIVAEGADDLGQSQLSGAATGDAHTLRTEGLVLDITSIEEDEEVAAFSGDFDRGTYTFEFEVTAFNGDFYMDEAAAIVDFDVLVDGVAAVSGSSTATLDISDADDAAVADKVINEGETATFTLTVETGDNVSGAVEVVINSVAYSAADDATEELTVDATPADDWTSGELILN